MEYGKKAPQRNKEQSNEQAETSEFEVLKSELTDCKTALETALHESAEHQNALLRARADIENERKRAEREIEKAYKFSVTQLLEALLPVKDSLELGLDAVDSAPKTQSLREGMQLTLNKLDAVLTQFGVEMIDPKDQPFNPEYHEAVTMEVVDDIPPNTVCQVQQKGYMLHGRVVRPARVTVSKLPQDSIA